MLYFFSVLLSYFDLDIIRYCIPSIFYGVDEHWFSFKEQKFIGSY